MRDETGFTRIPGYQKFHEFPPGEAIVSMIQHDGYVLVATSKKIYRLDGDRVTPLEIAIKTDVGE